VAFEIGYKIQNLIYLVFYNMYTPPQPYDKKLCSGFLAARMELGAALIFLVVPSPESVHDTAARHPGMWKFKAKWRPKRTSLAVQDMVEARNRALRYALRKLYTTHYLLQQRADCGIWEYFCMLKLVAFLGQSRSRSIA